MGTLALSRKIVLNDGESLARDVIVDMSALWFLYVCTSAPEVLFVCVSFVVLR